MHATGVIGIGWSGMCGGFMRVIGWCSIASSAISQWNHALNARRLLFALPGLVVAMR